MALFNASVLGVMMISTVYIVKTYDMYYNVAWAWIIGFVGFALVMFLWNIVTYNSPRIARRRG
jgi:hypothetical protein